MTDRPIIFFAPMVRALLDGRKTQARRVLKPPYDRFKFDGVERDGSWLWVHAHEYAKRPAPYATGDRLWVREAHALLPRTAYRASVGTGTIEQKEHPTDEYTAAVFREGFDRSGRPQWRPSIHMPRWASRLTLVITDVRVERLNDITHGDAVSEGMGIFPHSMSAQKRFREIWNSLHGPDAWDANPWVAAITFTVHRANIDALAPADALDIAGAA